MTGKRKRGQNFTADEKSRLVKIIAAHKETILNKKTDSSANEAKMKAWIAVTKTFNLFAAVHRPKESLTKMWEKLKYESKQYYQMCQRSTTKDGGTSSYIKKDPVLDQVCTLLGCAAAHIKVLQDSDTPEDSEGEETMPKRRCSEDEEDIMYIDIPIKNIRNPLNTEDANNENFNISKTPLSLRRQSQLSIKNERSERLSSSFSSYENDIQNNRKKEEMEDLQRQLLQDEIEFKRKLYAVQLEAAAKEVEIKTELLNQLKDRAINMKNSFGDSRRHSFT